MEALYFLNIFINYTYEYNILSRVYLIARTGNVVNFYKSDVKSCMCGASHSVLTSLNGSTMAFIELEMGRVMAS